MNHQIYKQQIIDYGNKLAKAKLTFSTGGNLSYFLHSENIMFITPSSIPYDEIQIEQIITMNLEGKIIEGNAKPSTEWRMHLEVYKKRKDVNCMIHAHALHLTTLSCLHWKLPQIDYLVAFSGGKEVNVTPYYRYGTEALAKVAVKYLENKYAIILGNHGVNVVAENFERAFAILENLEFCAQVFLKAKALGTPKELSDQEMEELILDFKNYGI